MRIENLNLFSREHAYSDSLSHEYVHESYTRVIISFYGQTLSI